MLLINTDISLTFLDWLGSPGGSKFSTLIEDMDMEELNACLTSFYTSARKQDGSFYKKTSFKSIRAAIDRFLRSPPRSKQFSITSHAAFTEANKVLDTFVKDLRKSGKIADLVHKKAISKQQIQKLFDCGNLDSLTQRIPHSYKGQLGFTLEGFLQDEDEKINVK